MNESGKKEFKSFLLKSTLLTVFLYGLLQAFFYLSPEKKFPHAYFLPIFFYLLSVGVHYFLVGASEKRPQQFVAYFMGSLSAKLFLSIGYIMFYALLNKASVVSFLISAFVMYLSFTILEVVSLLSFFNRIR